MLEKCENCFWNYSCAMACGDDIFEDDDIEYINNCTRYQE